jgi:hypothetical protein
VTRRTLAHGNAKSLEIDVAIACTDPENETPFGQDIHHGAIFCHMHGMVEGQQENPRPHPQACGFGGNGAGNDQ